MTDRRHAWAASDLARRLCDALDVASNAIEHLAPEGFTDAEEPANTIRPEKVISESGLLLLAASTAIAHVEVKRRLRDVADHLAPHARSERMLLGICTEPAMAWDYALAHICLKRLGLPDVRFDAVLHKIDRAQRRVIHERPPHRELEQVWIARGLDSPQRPIRQMIRRAAPPPARASVLCRPMDVLNGSRDDVYAFTHSLMYVTDFNIEPWRLPRQRKEILLDAAAALSRCLDDQDYDLAGEVLLAWPLTGSSWGAAGAFGFRVLAHVEDQAGFLPSPSTRMDRLNRLQGEDRTKYLLATAYHTAYVMGLLCAAALQSGRAPPTSIRAADSIAGVSQSLRARLDTDALRPHWLAEFDRLPSTEQDGLAGMLFTIALRRSVVQRDFSRLHDVLQFGQITGLTYVPAASQAAELLGRLACRSVA